VPTNAHLNYSGNQWSCDLGFERKAGGCFARDE
jgi:hypothetical protein